MRKAGKILVVDDYEANLRGLGQLLRSAEYSVTSATNGREALDLAKRERPDLVLLDVLMPGMSGVDVCRELKRSDETCLTPVVLISGAQERRTILDGLEAGADDFLIKPIDAEELHTRVPSTPRRSAGGSSSRRRTSTRCTAAHSCTTSERSRSPTACC